MHGLLDVENARLLTLTLSGGEAASGCLRCEAFQPAPQSDGSLLVDPEIHLPSPGMDVDVAYFYNSTSTLNGPFGYRRTLSTNLTAQASGSPAIVTLTRGNGSLVSYLSDGSGNYACQTPGVRNTLQEDTGNALWKESTPDGQTTAYPLDKTGQITSVAYAQDAVGNRHTFSYAGGLLQTLEDAVGRVVSFTYTGGALLQSIEDWAGRTTTFAYDTASIPGRPLLTTVTGPTGCQTGYQYDAFARLTGITSPNGYQTGYGYDLMGRTTWRNVSGAGRTTYTYGTGMMSVQDALGNTQVQALDTNNRLVGVVNPLGQQVSLTRNAGTFETSRQDPLGNTTTTLYDSFNLPTATIDALGHITTYTRDSFHNPISVQTADGAITTNVWGYAGSPFDMTGAKRRLQVVMDPLGHTTSYSYNGRGQMVAMQNALGYLTTYGYDSVGSRVSVQDALGNVTTSIYDLAGNVIGSMNPLGNVWTTTYDPQNRPLTTTDPLGNTTTTAYDSVGNQLVSVTPLGYRTSWSYNVFDQPTSQTDPLGNISTWVYDALGRSVAQVDPLGYRNTTVYDAAGKVVASVDALGNFTSTVYDMAGRAISSMDALQNQMSQVYDNVGRVIASIDALGYRTSYCYDVRNRRISQQDALGHVTTSVYDLAGKNIATINALGSWNTTVYDAANRRVSFIDALGRTTTSVYDAAERSIAITDALGFRRTSSYDVVGRKISSQDARGYLNTTVYDLANRGLASINALGNTTTTIYDAASRNIAAIDPLGRTTTSVYDAASRIISAINSKGERTSYGYDARGQNVSVQDALGHISTSVYDGTGRSVASVFPLGYHVTSIYDVGGQQVASQDALSLLSSVLYDANGRIKMSVNPLGFVSTYVYDAREQQLAVVDSLANRVSNIYDAAGRMQAQQDARGFLTSFVYDAAGQQLAVVDANGHRTSSLYDLRGSLLATQDAMGFLTSYQYDATGNKVQRTDARNLVTNYAIDPLNRKSGTRYADDTRVTNTWDAAGQPLTTQDVSGIYSYSHDLDGRQTQVVYPTGKMLSYSYDAVGNRSLLIDPDGGLTTYSYDLQSRMVNLVNPFAELTTVSYDALDREVHKVLANGLMVSYTYDAAGRELALTNRKAGPDVANDTTYYYVVAGVSGGSEVATSNEASARPHGTGSIAGLFNTGMDSSGNPVADGATDPHYALVSVPGGGSGTAFVTLQKPPIQSGAWMLDTNTSKWISPTADESTQPDPPGDYVYQTTFIVNGGSGGVSITGQVAADNAVTSILLNGVTVATNVSDGFQSFSPFVINSGFVAGTNVLQFIVHNLPYNNPNGTQNNPSGFRCELAGGALPPPATSVSGLYNTGVDSSGNPAPDSSADAHYILVSAPPSGGSATVTQQHFPVGNGVWMDDTAASKWISPRADESQYLDDPGNYTYETSFLVSGDPTGASISGRVAADNAVSAILLNGVTVATNVSNGFQNWSSFAIGSGLIVGTNKLQFIVNNQGDAPNPSGFRCELASVPASTGTTPLDLMATPGNAQVVLNWTDLPGASGYDVKRSATTGGPYTLIASNVTGTAYTDISVLAMFTNTYDAVGNRLSVTEADGTLVTYGYDASYQLVNERRSGSNAYNTTYTYDALGNRLVKNDSGQITNYSYNAANALVLTQPATGMSTASAYDANGNLSLENAGGVLTTYMWDGENRLTSVQAANGTETYAYSEDGLRKQKVTATGTTNFVWDEQNVLLEADASQVTQVHYTDNPSMWGGLASQRRASTSSFYGFDSQSSTRILVSVGGILTDSYSYKAFGEELVSGNGTANALRYVGQYGYYHDATSRLYVRARYLDNLKGRWFSQDPIGFESGDFNSYRYVLGNPATLSDPLGLAPNKGGCRMQKVGKESSICRLLGECYNPPCVDMTNDYADDYARTGNRLSLCASCVSQILCNYVKICDRFPANCMPYCYPRPYMECQNKCMHDHYFNHDLPVWKGTLDTCRRYGNTSYKCCIATMHAEQTGYTQCMLDCQMPPIPQNLREMLAVDGLKCCGEPYVR